MNKIIKVSYLSSIYLFFYLPIAVLCVYSFNNTQYSLIWHGFTFTWYKTLLNDSDMWITTIHSFTLASIAASTATCLGTIAAIAQYRYRFFGKQIYYGTVFFLIFIPDIVLGISFLTLFHNFHIQLGFVTLLIAHITFCIPFVIITCYNRLKTFDKHLFESAQDLGANDTTILCRIIIPLLWPAILAGWLLSFTLSIDDVIISYFVSGPGYEILPLKIYGLVRQGVNQEISALCALLFLVTLTLVTAAHFALRKRI